jgi:hypothetical protein
VAVVGGVVASFLGLAWLLSSATSSPPTGQTTTVMPLPPSTTSRVTATGSSGRPGAAMVYVRIERISDCDKLRRLARLLDEAEVIQDSEDDALDSYRAATAARQVTLECPR